MVADASPPLTLTLLTRPGCHLCDEARDELGLVLAERAAARATVPKLVEVDIESQPALLKRHIESIPVLDLAGKELPLAIRPQAIRRFLSALLDEAQA